MIKLRPWLRNSLIVATLFAVFLVGTPFLIQKLATDWLRKHGGEQVTIRNVDFNPFTGELVLEGLQVRSKGHETLSFDEALLDIAWLPLLDRHITVQAIHLSGFSGTVDNRNPEYLAVGGLHIPLGDSDQSQSGAGDTGTDWAAGIRQLSLGNIRLTYLDNTLKLNIGLDALELNVLEQWAPDTPAAISGQGHINGGAFNLKGKIKPFARVPRYQLSVTVKQLPLEPFAALAAPALTHLTGKLSLDSQLDVSIPDTGLQYEHHGNLLLETLQVWPGATQKEETPALELARLEATDMAITPALASTGRLHHSGLVLRLHIDEQGKLNLIKKPEQEPPSPPETVQEPKTTEQEPVMDIAIGEIIIDGDSVIHFSDDSVQPHFRLKAGVNTATLKHLDTRQPEQQSPFSVDVTPDRHASLKADGWVQPFVEPLAMDIKASARAIALPPLSSYTQNSLGLKLDSGTLDMDLALNSQGGKLDGKATLKLHQLALETVDSKNSLQDNLPVPINLALSTLRDKHNTIELDIPFSGDAGNPDFDVSDAIGNALASSLGKGAMTYLTVALQPYGAILTAAKFAGKKLGQVKLQPVTFNAGDATLPETQYPYLNKVAGLLDKRPKLTVRVCGTSVSNDIPALATPPAGKMRNGKPGTAASDHTADIDDTLREQLKALAQQRADAVMTYLIEQAGATPSQLVSCAPRVELEAPGAEPRTELLL